MKLRNPMAKELRTPKYKSKVVENKKKKLEDDISILLFEPLTYALPESPNRNTDELKIRLVPSN